MNLAALTCRRPAQSATESPAPGAPSPAPPQDEQRQRRRAWLRVHYSGTFDLGAEVAAIVAPLADAMAALPRPVAMRFEVDEVADAVHELLSAVVGMLAESRQLDKAAHVRTAQAARDLAQRPREPQINDKMLIAGTWAALLIDHVTPHSEDFAAYLGRALPPNDPRLTGPSASERLESALRVLDSAALDLQRRLPKVAARQALPSIEDVNAANKARRETARAERTLTKMRVAQ